MRLSSLLISFLTFAVAAAFSLVVAKFSVVAIERRTEVEVRAALDDGDLDWAEVSADGLRVILEGTAPDEAGRFAALSLVGGIVDAERVVDAMDVPPSEGLAPPRFSAEILRSASGLSIIGLIPEAEDRAALVERLQIVTLGDEVADLLETANYPVPDGWSAAMRFAVSALELLPRAKISVEAGAVSVTAMSDSAPERDALQQRLSQLAPPQIDLSLNIAAPRPVITPFTLRFLISDSGARFDACSAESAESRNTILRAANAVGLSGSTNCVIGMGVPSPHWAKAARLSIEALSEIGTGTLTISNADISLIASEGTDAALFDRVVGELENALPQVFALHAVLPVAASEDGAGPPEFTATLSPEGQVQLRGRINDTAARTVTTSYAEARFGADRVYSATRVVDGLPMYWSVHVLAALEGLSYLERGSVSVTPDALALRGMTHRKDAASEISKFLAAKLGEGVNYDLDITYEEPPAPEDQPISAELCQAQLTGVQLDSGKITFEPGSATVAADSGVILDKIVAILKDCGPVRLEIQGHTDSQGREEMNQNLSQARAQSVLNELRARRLLTSSFIAVGYGETSPIASNETEDGREANRRIDFQLLLPETLAAEDQEAAPSDAESSAEDASTEGGDTAAQDSETETTDQ